MTASAEGHGGACVAVYERTVRANRERVWENVLDWEHLPALHHGSFAAIRCQDSGPWGWRASIDPRDGGAPFVVELTIDHEDSSYHSRTVEGPGAGTDIFTRVGGSEVDTTDIRVEFFVPEAHAKRSERVGPRFVELYTRLWDEDEAMMRHRQAFLDGRADAIARPGERPRTPLGPADALRTEGRRVVRVADDAFVVRWLGDRFAAHTTVCPHWAGPLEDAEIDGDDVVCPWHGYRFDLSTGRGPAGQNCRLGARARVEIDGDDRAWLVVT